ncbi:MAG TPA: deoxyribodipyrimidine photo-lyase [Chitinophagaceae bacterium]|nr:deoxyribodipyrimidine photo-lyase [Chitinophagaceae bacterium]
MGRWIHGWPSCTFERNNRITTAEPVSLVTEQFSGELVIICMQAVNIFWFRRDLRLTDNAGLYHALTAGRPVIPIFIFDKNILGQLDDAADRRVEFIHAALENLQADLVKMNSSLEVYHGLPAEIFTKLLSVYKIGTVFTNGDYEPYAIERDEAIARLLSKSGTTLQRFKDQVIFEKDEIVKNDGKPYTVFTPYSKQWKNKLDTFYIRSYPVEKYFNQFFKQIAVAIPSLQEIGFTSSRKPFPSPIADHDMLRHYHEERDYPAKRTSRMGVHLRFGTVSIRRLAQLAASLNQTYLNELIWREFYQMILWHFPQVGKGQAFKKAYEFIAWRNDDKEFEQWCTGQTGYPIVDAGMRELNETGFMHNRVRMITASFLTKHLLIDWRWGEAYFAQKLLDFDLASNNGGWQWAAGSGCDAAPYFRIFNPTLQTKKFDPKLEYVRRWVPELETFHYPKPIVEHEFARKRCLEAYREGLRVQHS